MSWQEVVVIVALSPLILVAGCCALALFFVLFASVLDWIESRRLRALHRTWKEFNAQ